MPETVSPLMREFLAWISDRPRTYAEAMEAWQTTCPRHTVWEDALIDGLIQVDGGSTPQQSQVTLTPRGKAILADSHSRKSTQTDPLPHR
jgi:hypothetical protein